MQPTTMPTIVKLRNAVTASGLDQHVVAVAAEGVRRVVDPHELAPLHLDDDVTGGRLLARRVVRRVEPVAVELVDVLEGTDEPRTRGLGARRLERLHEEPGRLPAVDAEQVDGVAAVRLLQPRV